MDGCFLTEYSSTVRFSPVGDCVVLNEKQTAVGHPIGLLAGYMTHTALKGLFLAL